MRSASAGQQPVHHGPLCLSPQSPMSSKDDDAESIAETVAMSDMTYAEVMETGTLVKQGFLMKRPSRHAPPVARHTAARAPSYPSVLGLGQTHTHIYTAAPRLERHASLLDDAGKGPSNSASPRSGSSSSVSSPPTHPSACGVRVRSQPSPRLPRLPPLPTSPAHLPCLPHQPCFCPLPRGLSPGRGRLGRDRSCGPTLAVAQALAQAVASPPSPPPLRSVWRTSDELPRSCGGTGEELLRGS